MSGFGDDEKLRAARELAQSFSKSKPAKKKNVGGGNYGPRPVIYVPQHHQSAPLIRQPPVTRPAVQNFAPSNSAIPPPSKRNYSATTSFSTGRAGKSVIGTSGLDFLKASGAKARDNVQPQPSSVSIASEVTSTIEQTEKISTTKQSEKISTIKHTEKISTIEQTEKINTIKQTEINNGTSTSAHLPTIPPQAPESAPFGNILDAFLSIVAKKPSLDQEIDTLTKILPKTLDLNATAPAASDAPPAKGHSIGDTAAAKDNNVPQGSSVGVSQNRVSDHSPSNKVSPVATAVVSNNGKVQGQTVRTNGVSKVSVTVTKGLATSSWA